VLLNLEKAASRRLVPPGLVNRATRTPCLRADPGRAARALLQDVSQVTGGGTARRL